MRSLWWLCTTQWRRGTSRVSGEGKEERGQGRIALGYIGVERYRHGGGEDRLRVF